MRTIIATLAIGGLLLGAGCSSDKESSGSSAPSGLQSYPSAQALADDLAAGGFNCERPERPGQAKYAAARFTCFNGGREYTLSTRLTPGERDLAVLGQEGLLGERGIRYGMVAGADWTVSCGGPDTCQEIQQIIGGEVSAKEGK